MIPFFALTIVFLSDHRESGNGCNFNNEEVGIMRRFVTAVVLLFITLFASLSWAFDTEELAIIETKTIMSGQKSVDVFVGKKTKNDVFSQYEYYGFSNGSLLMYGVKPASGDEVIFSEPSTILPPAPLSVGNTWNGYLDMPTKEKIEEIASTELFGKSYPSLKLLVSSVEGYPLVNKWYLDGVGMLGGHAAGVEDPRALAQ